MGNTQNSIDGGEEDAGWCAAKREVKEHGQKPKLNFERRQPYRKGEKKLKIMGGFVLLHELPVWMVMVQARTIILEGIGGK